MKNFEYFYPIITIIMIHKIILGIIYAPLYKTEYKNELPTFHASLGQNITPDKKWHKYLANPPIKQPIIIHLILLFFLYIAANKPANAQSGYASQ